MRKSIRRSRKNKKRSNRRSRRRSNRRSRRRSKSKQRSRKRRSVRMRWISPGGTVHPNRDGMGDGAGRSIAQMINSYTDGYIPEDINEVITLVKQGKWDANYVNKINNKTDFITVVKAAVSNRNKKAIAALVQLHYMDKNGWEYIVNRGYWDDDISEFSTIVHRSMNDYDRIIYVAEKSNNDQAAAFFKRKLNEHIDEFA